MLPDIQYDPGSAANTSQHKFILRPIVSDLLDERRRHMQENVIYNIKCPTF